MTIEDSPLSQQPPETGDQPSISAQPPASAAAMRDLPQDLRAPWGWLDLLLLAVLALAASVLLSLLLGRAFAAFGVKLAQLRASPSKTGLFTILHQVLLFLVLLGYLAAQIRVTFRAPFWRTIGWHALDPGRAPRALRYIAFIAGGFLLAASVQIASVAFGNRAKVPMQTLFQDRRTALLLILTAVFFAPVIEETIFRGYIYPVVARRFGVVAGVIGTGVIVGLLHAPQLWGGWVQIALLVVVGIVLTSARAATRTVLASYLLHVSYNFFTSFAFLLGS
ncbi:MAG: CPBP family intramembrane glutamic endopeptidase, partial [Candidatus Acidiferrales bacterium]